MKEKEAKKKKKENMKRKRQRQTRMRSRSGPIANPNTYVFDPPSTPSPTPEQIDNSVQYVICILFLRTHTKFGIKILELTW